MSSSSSSGVYKLPVSNWANENLGETDARYHFKLSEILRLRRRPVFLILNEAGEVLHSCLTDEATAEERRMFKRVVREARDLINNDVDLTDMARQLVVQKPGERCALINLETGLASLRVFPLQSLQAGHDAQYAALVEPIVKPHENAVDYQKVKDRFRLSAREVDVLKALMSGEKDKEIAALLGVTAETVRAYQKSLRAKMGVSTRTAVVCKVHEFASDLNRLDA